MIEWMPCSVKLPEKDGCYLVTMKYERIEPMNYVKKDYEEAYAVIISCFTRGKWDVTGEVIAWQHLPYPYKDK